MPGCDGGMKRMVFMGLLLLSPTMAGGLWFVVPSSGITRLAVLAAVGCAWLGMTLICWKNKVARTILLALPVLAGFGFLLPAKEVNRESLRDDYVKRMVAFEGTKYFWGGEGWRGIDCSGLPRRALRDALLAEGVRNLNGGALRSFAEQWWFDASALALMEGYRSYAKPLGVAGTIRTMDYGNLLPGDLAITATGNHVMIYLGGERWIQADPGEEKVLTEDARKSGSSWFDAKVAMFRWSVL